ncbi:effector-associated constant component EACC1 [Streptomyces tauricus]|uniref:effector-associated constant component EACC1 n=1 Tax=Streptomyces tauricus TaxID=68274 RepID=UPI003805580C
MHGRWVCGRIRWGAGVRLELQVGSGVGELRSLRGWLRADPVVRRSVVVGVRGGVQGSGEMGSALDVLGLVTGNGWSAASFVVAVAAWRQSRPGRPRVRSGGGRRSSSLRRVLRRRSRGRFGRWRPSVTVRVVVGECAARSGGLSGGAGGHEPL